MATQQEFIDAQVALLKQQATLCDAETEKERTHVTCEIAKLAMASMNDRAAGSGRTQAVLEAAVKEAGLIWRLAAREAQKPDIWGEK
jgi:hypothetical protein